MNHFNVQRSPRINSHKFRTLTPLLAHCTIQEAAKNALKKMENSLKSHRHGGVIAIDRNGNLGIDFNIKKMPWASVKDGRLRAGFYQNIVDTDEQLP